MSGRYQLLEIIGDTRISTVFKALDLVRNLDVAVKILKQQAINNRFENIQRFRREAQILSSLHHPNLVKIYEAAEFSGMHYLVMELLNGQGMDAYIGKRKTIDVDEILDFSIGVLDALAYVHNIGIIHRDLKPANIFISGMNIADNSDNPVQQPTRDNKDRVKILDFGLSQLVETIKTGEESSVQGTFAYISPEQIGILQRPVDERSDLYAFGVILYELVTGVLPFEAAGLGDLITMRITKTARQPRLLNISVPEELEKVILKLLSADPDDRYQASRGLVEDLVRIRNKETLFVLGRGDVPKTISFHTGMVGRDAELSSLRNLYNQASQGAGSVCFISGESGAGKSRLVEELRKFVLKQGGEFIGGKYLSQENKIPYQSFSEALHHFVGRIKQMPSHQRDLRVKKMKNVLGGLSQIVISLCPSLHELLGDAPEPVKLDLDKENRRYAHVCSSFFLSLGEINSPLVLFLDDLQWADEASLSLLRHIMHEVRQHPILVLAAFRSEEVSQDHSVQKMVREAKDRNVALISLRLAGLSAGEIRSMLVRLFGELQTDAFTDVSEFLYKKTSGNPFFILQIARELVSMKIAQFQDDRWVLDMEKLAKAEVPATMLDIVLRRIELLTEHQKGLLSAASVIGSRFRLDVLYKTCELSREEITRLIDEAQSLQLVETGSAEGEAKFVHDKVREAFYQRIPEKQRKDIHSRVGAVLEQVYAGSLEKVIFELANHYASSVDDDQALLFVVPAAEAARAQFANQEAIGYYSTGLTILEKKGEQGSQQWLKIKGVLAGLHSVIGDNDRAIQIATDLLGHTSAACEKAAVYRSLGLFYCKKSDYAHAEDCLAQGFSCLGRRLPRKRTAVVLSILWGFLVHCVYCTVPRLFERRKAPLTREREIVLLYESASTLYGWFDYVKYFSATLSLMNFASRNVGKSRELAGAYTNYAMVFMAIPWFGRSIVHHHKALSMCRELKDEVGIAYSLRTLGFMHIVQGSFSLAERYFLQAGERYRAMGDSYELTHVLNGLQLIYFNRAEIDRRLPVLRELLDISSQVANHYCAGAAIAGLAGNYLISGDLDEAEKWVRRACEFNEKNKLWLALVTSRLIYSQIAFERGDIEGAIRHADCAAQIEKEHSLIKTAIAHLYIWQVDSRISRFSQRIEVLTGKERRTELKDIKNRIAEIKPQTQRWPLWQGMALRSRAEYYAAIGNNRRARRLFSESIENLEFIERRYEAARSYFSFGLFLQKLGKNEDAAQSWQKAYNLFMSIGARLYIKRTAAFLGIRPDVAVEPLASADAQRLASLLEVSRDISSILDIDVLLSTILMKAVKVTGAKRGYLFIVNDESKTLELKFSHNILPDSTAEPAYSTGIVDRVLTSQASLISTDAGKEKDLSTFESVQDYNLRSVLCTPIRHHEKLLGVCYLDNPLAAGVFTAQDESQLNAFMVQAAISLENARAYQKIRDLNSELEREGQIVKDENLKLKKLVQFNVGHLKTFGELHIVTQDERLLETINKIERFAKSRANVLITGDSGVGKEIFARLIQKHGDRSEKPFIRVNSSAIPESLFESEFFGYEKGAFTGAIKSKQGKFELADHGTLFLDEVAEFPLSQQAKLLRVLEDGEITRVGGTAPIPVDIKVITATNRDLRQMVKDGSLREDLYFRLNVLELHIPSLKERPDDIPVLAAYFLSQVANEEGGPEKYFEDEALVFMQEQSFPGNVRQLRNLVHRLYVSHEGDAITRDEIQSQYRFSIQGTEAAVESATPLEEQAVRVERPDSFFEQSMNFNEFKRHLETRYLEVQLKKHGYNVSRTAKALGLLPSALFRKLKSLDLKTEKEG